MKLIGLVARRQRHPVQLCHVPAFDNVPPAAGIIAQAFDDFRNLIDARPALVEPVLSIAIGRPINPLLAVYRPQITPLTRKLFVVGNPLNKIIKRDVIAGFLDVSRVRPFIPYLHALQYKRTNVGLASQEPQHLARRGFPVDPLRGE